MFSAKAHGSTMALSRTHRVDNDDQADDSFIIISIKLHQIPLANDHGFAGHRGRQLQLSLAPGPMFIALALQLAFAVGLNGFPTQTWIKPEMLEVWRQLRSRRWLLHRPSKRVLQPVPRDSLSPLPLVILFASVLRRCHIPCQPSLLGSQLTFMQHMEGNPETLSGRCEHRNEDTLLLRSITLQLHQRLELLYFCPLSTASYLARCSTIVSLGFLSKHDWRPGILA